MMIRIIEINLLILLQPSFIKWFLGGRFGNLLALLKYGKG
jgi:hypothetical protein